MQDFHRYVPQDVTHEFRIAPPYVVCVARYQDERDIADGTGVAKCHPEDEWNEMVGRAIAKGRAEKALVERINPLVGRLGAREITFKLTLLNPLRVLQDAIAIVAQRARAGSQEPEQPVERHPDISEEAI